MANRLLSKPRVIVSVTSDLVTDQRVNRSCKALLKQGFEVVLVGRELPGSGPVEDRNYKIVRFKLPFTKGPLFYAFYSIRLFIFLFTNKADVFFANDLDTLPANYFASKFKKVKLIYDSHEYYTGVPELENRKLVKGIWQFFEKIIFPKLTTIITVNDSIAELYEKEYQKKLIVIRNVPFALSADKKNKSQEELRKQLGLPLDKKLIILQGAGINVERGAEEAVEAMQFCDNIVLIILGGGDVMQSLLGLVNKFQLQNKVKFFKRMPYTEMMQYTMACDIGLSFDKNTNLNYRFSLPNKLFDYIQAGIPVLASRLPEVEKIINGYSIGSFIENHEPAHIANKLKSILLDEITLGQWKKNVQLAAAELNWEVESEKFPLVINELHRK
jgi:glycosyltransferase involved in cell wall biosynthesis